MGNLSQLLTQGGWGLVLATALWMMVKRYFRDTKDDLDKKETKIEDLEARSRELERRSLECEKDRAMLKERSEHQARELEGLKKKYDDWEECVRKIESGASEIHACPEPAICC